MDLFLFDFKYFLRGNNRYNLLMSLEMYTFSAVPVCKPSARNITKIYRPLMNFIEEIESSVGMKQEGRHIALYHYVVDHVGKTFINQIKADLRQDIDAATKAWLGHL